MPPRLSLAAPARALLRPFTTSAAAALPPREGTNTSHRLANLSSPSPAARSPPNSGETKRSDAASRLLERYRQRSAGYMREKKAQLDYLRHSKESSEFLRQMPRRWQAGDVYSPHDLNPVEMQKWRRRTVRNDDVVDALGINPLDLYKNFALVQHFTTGSAMIKHSELTRLRPVNQRKVAKMVRRVQGMGLYPTVHSHPELIRERFFAPNNRR